MVTGRGAHEEIDVVAGLSHSQQSLGQRGRSLPGRGAGRQGFSLQAAGMVHAAAQGRLHRLRHRLLDLDRGEPGPHLPASSRARIRMSTSGGSATKAATDYPHVHDPAGRALTRPHPPPRGDGCCGSRSGPACPSENWRGELPRRSAGVGRRSFALSDGGRGVSAVQVHPSVDDKALLAIGPDARRWAKTSNFPRGSRFRPRNVPNRRGVEAVARPLSQRDSSRLDELARSWTRAQSRRLGCRRIQDRLDRPGHRRRFERLKLLVVQDLFPSPLVAAGDLPVARRGVRRTGGSYVNRADRLQSVPGPSARRLASGRKGASIGSSRAKRACTMPGPCWRDCPQNHLFFRGHGPSAGDGGRFEGEYAGRRNVRRGDGTGKRMSDSGLRANTRLR